MEITVNNALIVALVIHGLGIRGFDKPRIKEIHIHTA